MNDQLLNQKELLYSPKNWAFLAFLLSPILPAILYYRNSKLLGNIQKGKKILIGSIVFVVAFMALGFSFDYYSTLIIAVEAIIAVIVAKKLAKEQAAAYEEMKKTKGLKGGRNEAPIILIFITIVVTIIFVFPYLIDKYIGANYFTTKINGETVYLPKNQPSPLPEKVEKSLGLPVAPKQPTSSEVALGSMIKGKVKLILPAGYVLSTKNENTYPKSFSFSINRTNGAFDEASWGMTIVPLTAVQHFDSVCPPGDCMRDYFTFPKAVDYLTDLEDFKQAEEPLIAIFNGQKYYVATIPVNGDIGYHQRYLTYFNDTRVIFSAWAATKAEAYKHDDFMKQVKILSIE